MFTPETSIRDEIWMNTKNTVITAGATYLDIDAYACMVAMEELLVLQGVNAVAFSNAPCNYSVCPQIAKDGQIKKELPCGSDESSTRYIIVDVSDPEFLKDSVPLDRVAEIYDHHTGAESYWTSRIGSNAHIEFVGAAATMVFREWKKAGLEASMTRSTALLLIAAILDNTLYLSSENTTPEDINAFEELCKKENIDDSWCASYFTEVQKSVEADLKNAIFGDIKTVFGNPILPQRISQLCVWDTGSILAKISEIRSFFCDASESWMLNIVDIKQHCSYFLCDDKECQKKIEKVFDVCFQKGIAKTQVPYLRKEIIKKSTLD